MARRSRIQAVWYLEIVKEDEPLDGCALMYLHTIETITLRIFPFYIRIRAGSTISGYYKVEVNPVLPQCVEFYIPRQ